jgi:hypothetical protein
VTAFRQPLLGCLVLAMPALAAAPPVKPVPVEPLRRAIDRLLADRDSVPAPDAEFLRRAYLDLTGCIPGPAEARAFLADRSPGKRAALIDRLLASPEHARHLATWLDVMLMERLPDRAVGRAEWAEFLYRAALSNMPWDAVAREVLSGDGSDPKRLHRVKFFAERGEPNVVTRDVSRLFLGTNLQCAQCHDHPRVEEYKQEDYYGLYAFIGRVTFSMPPRNRSAALPEKADGETTFQSVFDPRKVTKTALPRVPGGPAIPDPPNKPKGYSRRAALAGAVARADYLPFRRNIANRLWALVMGRGLIEPLDMDHPGNPPAHPELLDLLADDIAARKFDLRGFLREVTLSEAYQRSSELPSGGVAKGASPFAAAVLKPLTPEQLAFSLMRATGVTDAARQSLGKGATEPALHARLAGNVAPFVRAFGSPAGTIQTFDPSMNQALFLANGPTVRSWLKGGGLVARLRKLQGDALADELYLSVLTRLPDAEERREAAGFLARTNGDVADLAWALLASTEFRFNH